MVVFLGVSAGPPSLQKFVGDFSREFWRVLSEIFLEDFSLGIFSAHKFRGTVMGFYKQGRRAQKQGLKNHVKRKLRHPTNKFCLALVETAARTL